MVTGQQKELPFRGQGDPAKQPREDEEEEDQEVWHLLSTSPFKEELTGLTARWSWETCQAAVSAEQSGSKTHPGTATP